MENIKKTAKKLLVWGPFCCLLFNILVFVQGFVRKDYSSLRFPLSSLSIGEDGWVQITNFIISGVLLVAFAFGLQQTLDPSKDADWTGKLIGAVGCGLIGSGIFYTDAVYGYPTTVPLVVHQYTVRGHLHDFFSLIVFICLPIACFKFYKRFIKLHKSGWAIYSLISGTGMLMTFILAGIGFKQVPGLVAFAGLFQRLSIIIGLTWISLTAVCMIYISPKWGVGVQRG